jgi:hypothetical protein
LQLDLDSGWVHNEEIRGNGGMALLNFVASADGLKMLKAMLKARFVLHKRNTSEIDLNNMSLRRYLRVVVALVAAWRRAESKQSQPKANNQKLYISCCKFRLLQFALF